MSLRAQIVCDGCGAKRNCHPRQPHSERSNLHNIGWLVGSPGGRDFCPACRAPRVAKRAELLAIADAAREILPYIGEYTENAGRDGYVVNVLPQPSLTEEERERVEPWLASRWERLNAAIEKVYGPQSCGMAQAERIKAELDRQEGR